MKRFSALFVILMVLGFSSCDVYADSTYSAGSKYSKEIASTQVMTQEAANTILPVPRVNNFLERKVISDWTKRWDVPNKPCYVYVFMSDKCIGYFVTNGKPASTRSYLLPEEYDLYDVSYSSSHIMKQSMDIDGTYGDNNPGYRMFLASGQAMEVSGYNSNVIYSDAPIPALSTTCLGK